MTMIETEPRGVLIARPLIWTILVTLLGAALWVGAQANRVDEMAGRALRLEARVAALESRAGIAERENAVAAARWDEVLRLLERLDGRVARIEASRAAE